MRYIPIVLILALFAVLGCISGPAYKDTTASDLLSNPGSFEGKKLCVSGVIENGSISGIALGKSGNFTGDYKNWTFSKICGIYMQGRLDAETLEPILSIATDKEVYHSNETLKVHVDFTSPDDTRGQVRVSGIKNAFGRASLNETREEDIKKGSNGFDFEFKVPSCEECSAVSPGMHSVNATVAADGKTFETYRRLVLERTDSNASGARAEDAHVSETVAERTGSAVTVEYFYDPACQKCAKASPVVESVISSYGDRVNFTKYNILTDKGLELAKEYQLPGVPSIVINKGKLIAYDDYGGDTGKLEVLLRQGIDGASTANAAGTSNASGYMEYLRMRLRESIDKGPTWEDALFLVPLVVGAGLFSGFNACLLAILAFIASVTLTATGKRSNVILIVLMFSLGIFTTYLISGIFLLRVIEQSPGLEASITNIILLVVTLLGLWHIYDAYHLRKNAESTFYTPKAFVRLTESVTKKVSLPASFLIGAVFSLIKAPCIGAVYLLILDMVRSGKSVGLLYVAAFNLGVVLPVLILGAAIAFGLDPQKVEKFRKERRVALRLITGATLLAVAFLMYAKVLY